ncbi:MAG TPA: YggS family pyridoxal phosphate-dependent enzyme [Nitrospiria bacterium]
MTSSVTENLVRIRERMADAARRAGRDPDRISLVAVTKGVPVEKVREAVLSGAGVLGENRVQEALGKMAAVDGAVRWHLIGHLQHNKVRHAVGRFDLIHSLDRSDLAREMDARAARADVRQRVLIQVNVSGEGSKHGVSPDGLEALARETAGLPHLALEGLMTIPPLADDPEASRPYYRCLAGLAEGLKKEGFLLPELSMGMSNDFEIAIGEGATMVRVGTAIFGPRPAPEEEA